MRLTYRLLFIGALLALVIGCQSPESSDSSDESNNPGSNGLVLGQASKVSSVTAVAPVDLASSGATVFPDSFEDLWNLGLEVRGAQDDSDLAALEAARDSALGGTALAVLKNAGANILETAGTSFLTNKEYTKSISLESDSLGDVFVLNNGTADLSVKAITFDDGAIAGDAYNLEAASASAEASVDVALNTDNEVVTGSFLRDAIVRVNFGTDWLAEASQEGDFTSTGTGTISGTFAYGINASWGFSINKNGTGGKIILSAVSSLKTTSTVQAPVSSIDAGVSAGEDLFNSNEAITVTAKVYNDANVLQSSFTYETTISKLFETSVPLVTGE